MAKQTNVTVLTDENGVQREYNEVKRRADVGERIKIVDWIPSAHLVAADVRKGEVLTVKSVKEDRVQAVQERYIAASPIPAEYVVLEPTSTVIVDGVRYREEKRKARVGERVLIVNPSTTDGKYDKGDVLTIVRYGLVGLPVSNVGRTVLEKEYVVLTPVAEPSAPITITIPAIHVTVASMDDAVQAVADAVKAEISKLAVAHPKSKSAQELRDEIVERAKADVAELTAIGTDEDVLLEGSANVRGDFYRVDFVVNRDKRTVVALVRPTNGYRTFTKGGVTLFKGIAKCAPGDVFNSHIGRAIALRRALGLEVPTEYTSAPQPTEIRIGDVVESKLTGKTFVTGNRAPHRDDEGYGIGYKTTCGKWFGVNQVKVIDDSREEVSA
ncbi:hypothetical protein V5G20_17885 [Brevibacillus borstelensis]|uniref:hypothetical protein n=1 Tax=Brevibacillus borstelensis TaxID=45462 RepID=UPI0030D1B7F0